MNPSPFELQAITKLHRRSLRQEAERERLLAECRSPRARPRPLLARAGRFLIAIGARLEARYAGAAPAAHANGGRSYP